MLDNAGAGILPNHPQAVPSKPKTPAEVRNKQPPVLSASCGSPPVLYSFEHGLRRVAPYFFTYNTWVKERWRGRGILDVFECEFRDRPVEYYREAIESGQVTVNGKVVGPEHILKNGELVSHSIHRHEPPVTADPVGVIHEDDDMIVINKPSGVPVHPAGRYKYNSVIEIIKSERGPTFEAYPCNRLDRLTSGIMFIAKHPKAAGRLGLQITERTVRKEYLARVIGEFPDGEVVCDQPILQISPKLGLNRVRANGKPSRTVFKRMAYYPSVEQEPRVRSEAADASARAALDLDGRAWRGKEGYSIVRCRPVTGRTHQIRVHLQFLGHPIQNDPIYANQRVWGFNLGYDDAEARKNSDEDIINRLARMGKEEVAEAVAYYDEMVDEYHKKKAEKISGKVCDVCQTPLYTDPGSQELSLWLHSLSYEDENGAWGYKSALPAWALPPIGMQGPKEIIGEVLGAADEPTLPAPELKTEFCEQ